MVKKDFVEAGDEDDEVLEKDVIGDLSDARSQSIRGFSTSPRLTETSPRDGGGVN